MQFPETLHRLEREFRAYYHALPGLLADGAAGRYVLVKGSDVLSLWNDAEDGLQAAVDRFGPGSHFLLRKVSQSDVELLRPFFALAPAVAV